MNRVSSIVSQMLQLVPRLEFEAAVRQHQAERHASPAARFRWTLICARQGEICPT